MIAFFCIAFYCILWYIYCVYSVCKMFFLDTPLNTVERRKLACQKLACLKLARVRTEAAPYMEQLTILFMIRRISIILVTL